MLLVELALQSVRGFGPQLRIPLKPGINVAKSADAKVRAALIDAIYHTLYPDPARGSATSHLAEGKESRIALTFYGRDKATYRLLRDVENGATRLLKFDPEQKKYGMFAESTLEAAQYVRVQQQLPDEVSFERLFLFSPESMPGKGGKAKTRSGAPVVTATSDIAPSGPGLAGRFSPPVPQPRAGSLSGRPPARGASSPGRQPSLPPSTFGMQNALVRNEIELDLGDDDAPADDSAPEEKKPQKDRTEEKLQQLEHMRKELLGAQRAEAAQAELDHLNLAKVELSEKADRVVKLRQELERLKKEAPSDERLEQLPQGFEQRLRDFEALEAKFNTEQARVQDEVITFESEDEKTYVTPLTRDPYFVAGLLGAGAMVFFAIFFERPAIALFNVLGVMVAAGAAFHWVAMLEAKAKMSIRTVAAKDRLQRLEKQRSLDTGVTRRLMQDLEIDSPAAMLERVSAFHAGRNRVAEVQGKLNQLISDPELKRAEEELRGLGARIEALEAEVLGASSTALSADTLEKRVRILERELEGAGVKVPPRPAAVPLKRAQPAKNPTGDLVLSTDDLPASSPKPAPRSVPPRATSIVEFAPPMGEPLLRSPTLSGLPAWPPPGVESASSDLPFQSNRSTPAHIAAPRGGSVVGKPVAPPPAKPRSPSIPGGADRKASLPPVSAPPSGGPTPRVTSVPGVLAPRRPLDAPAKAPSRPSAPAAPAAPAKKEFDFSGGMLGSDDEEESEGYGAGYGGGAGGSDDDKKGPLEEGLLAATMGGAGSGFPGRAGSYGGEEGGAAPEPDRSRDLIQAAVDLLQQDVDSLTKSIESRLGQYLMAFTDKRYQTPTFGVRGEVSVVSSDGGEPKPYMELDDELIDLVDASIRFSLVEAILRKVRVPILMDDPFTAFPARRRKLLTQMVGYLGGATQLVIATQAEDLTGNELKLTP